MPATLREFAEVNDQVAATTKKLQKQSILANYFRTLDESDLRLAVRYSAGRNFPSTDERVLGVGWSAVNDVVLSLVNLDVSHGETGEALARVWPTQTAPTTPLTLADLSTVFDTLSATGNMSRKRELLYSLYSRCSHPRESAYLSKI